MIESFYLHSSRSDPRLRIGVMIDDSKLIAPFAAVLRHIQQSNFAGLELVIRKERRPSTLSSNRLVRSLQVLSNSKRRSQLAYDLYGRWDRATNSEAAKALALEDCTSLLGQAPELLVTPLEAGPVQRLSPEAIDDIRNARLDVILRFGFNILKGDILNCARFGVWSFHHGDNDFYRGGPAAFWELVERQALTGALLQVLNEELDAGLVLAKTLTPTKLGSSRVVNMVAPYLSAEPMIIEKLHQLHEKGWDAVLADALPKRPYLGRKEIYRAPTNTEMAKWIVGNRIPAVVRRIAARDTRARHWAVGIRRPARLPPWQSSWSSFRWLDAPAGRLFADPFLFEHAGRTWLFVEDYHIAKRKGAIACAELKDDSEVGPWQVVLECPYHLSFPYVFERDGQILMIPEARQSGRVELFKAVDFPGKWTLDHVLLDKPGLDTSLHVADDGTHYFFTSIRHAEGAHPQLFLFTSLGLREPWSLHPASPLSRDARYSRNAGPILKLDGSLIRPSQDATLFYGQSSHFHRIEELTPSTYRETLLGSRGTDLHANALGTHTYCRSASWETVDCLQLGHLIEENEAGGQRRPS